MKSNSNHTFFLFISMIIVLVIALLGDQWINFTTLRAQNSFDFVNTILFAKVIGQFIVIGGCIFLYWLVIQKSPPNLILSLFFIAIGLFLSFFNIVATQFSALNSMTITVLYPFSSSHLHLTAGAFIFWIGFINLFRYLNQSNEENSQS